MRGGVWRGGPVRGGRAASASRFLTALVTPPAPPGAQVRFSRHVFPGETLQVEMWRQGRELVVFQTRVVERDVLAISNAAVQLYPQGGAATATRLARL